VLRARGCLLSLALLCTEIDNRVKVALTSARFGSLQLPGNLSFQTDQTGYNANKCMMQFVKKKTAKSWNLSSSWTRLQCKVKWVRKRESGRTASWINNKVCSSVVQLYMIRADINHGMHPSMHSGKIRKPRFCMELEVGKWK
jgi:hypothetical protein